MGSRPSKVAPVRTRSGLSFVSTSSVASLSTIESDYDAGTEGVRNFAFDDVTTKSFKVGWDPPKSFSAVSYQVRLFPPDKIKSRTLLRAHPDQWHTFTKLNSATEYSVAVTAIDGDGNKSACETASVFTLPRPPRNLQFTSAFTSTSVKVRWKHCKGKPGSYLIEVMEEGANIPIAQDSNVTDCTKLFKGLTPGTEYSVTVWNVIKNRRSEPITDQYMTAPRHVTDVTFSDVTQHEMTLKWKKPEGKVYSYSLILSEHTKAPGSPIEIDNLTKTTFTFNGLIPGRLYKCKIVSNALQRDGVIISSKPQLFTQCTVPLEVAGVKTSNIGPEEALVAWTPGNGDADDYDLFLTPIEGVIGETAPRGITKTKYKFTGLVPGTIYTIGIVTNSKDKSSKREISSFATAPGMVGDIQISNDQRSCTTQRIDWPSAAGRVDSYVLNIRRKDKEDDGKTIKNISKTHHLFEGLTAGTLYKVEVAVMREGRESSSVNQTFGTIPAAVPSLTITKDQCSWNRIFCTWSHSVGGVENYKISCKSAEGKTTEVIIPSNKNEYLLSDLQPSTVYDVTITAISNEIESFPVTVQQITGSTEVEQLQAVPLNKKEIKATWSPPPHGAEQYLLILKSLEEDNTELEVEYTTSECHQHFNNLTPGSLYQISISPVSNLVTGKPSTVQAHTKPGDVQNVYIPEDKVETDSIYIKWWGVEGNENDVEVVLTEVKREDDVESDFTPIVIKEELIKARKDEANEITFADLKPDTTYGIRFRAVGKSGVGSESFFTRTTKAPIPESFESEETAIQPPETEQTVNLPVEENDVINEEAGVATETNETAGLENKKDETCVESDSSIAPTVTVTADNEEKTQSAEEDNFHCTEEKPQENAEPSSLTNESENPPAPTTTSPEPKPHDDSSNSDDATTRDDTSSVVIKNEKESENQSSPETKLEEKDLREAENESAKPPSSPTSEQTTTDYQADNEADTIEPTTISGQKINPVLIVPANNNSLRVNEDLTGEEINNVNKEENSPQEEKKQLSFLATLASAD